MIVGLNTCPCWALKFVFLMEVPFLVVQVSSTPPHSSSPQWQSRIAAGQWITANAQHMTATHAKVLTLCGCWSTRSLQCPLAPGSHWGCGDGPVSALTHFQPPALQLPAAHSFSLHRDKPYYEQLVGPHDSVWLKEGRLQALNTFVSYSAAADRVCDKLLRRQSGETA